MCILLDSVGCILLEFCCILLDPVGKCNRIPTGFKLVVICCFWFNKFQLESNRIQTEKQQNSNRIPTECQQELGFNVLRNKNQCKIRLDCKKGTTIRQNTDDLKILSPKFCRFVRFDYSIPTGLQQTTNRFQPTESNRMHMYRL